MSTRDDRDATYREARELLAAAHDGWDATTRQAAMRRHPSRFSLDQTNRTWDDTDQLAAWSAHLDAQPEPEMSPLHKVAVWVLLDTAALLVLLVVGRIVWQGISTVVGL